MLVTHNTAVGAIADGVVYLRSVEVIRVDRVEHPVDPEFIRW
jgi:hypothetical protein